MNTTTNYIPDNWKSDQMSFLNWMTNHVKSKYLITEDYQILNYKL